MTPVDADPRWPKLLSLAVHEFRTPMTVVAGYIRMLLKDRAGPLSDQQRKLLEEAEKSCGRLSALIGELSDVSSLEGGTASFNRSRVDVQSLLRQAISMLPAMPDREITVELDGAPTGHVNGDAARLQSALTSVLTALRRELVTANRLLVRAGTAQPDGKPSIHIAIGDEDQIEAIAAADPRTLARFDEWRGGSGLSLAIARRIIDQHGGALLSPPGDGKAGAVVTLPRE
jgi:signal transduction histidine kinase